MANYLGGRGPGLWIGLGLIAFAVLLASVTPLLLNQLRLESGLGIGPAGVVVDPSDFDSLGEQIFLTGTDGEGRVIPRSGGMMMLQSCAACHGRDGRGRNVGMMMADLEAPDIRWATLSEEMDGASREGHEPYSTGSFARALREGIDPGGERLSRLMPRWQLGDTEIEALMTYLKAL